jgi:hypothetical protein
MFGVAIRCACIGTTGFGGHGSLKCVGKLLNYGQITGRNYGDTTESKVEALWLQLVMWLPASLCGTLRIHPTLCGASQPFVIFRLLLQSSTAQGT